MRARWRLVVAGTALITVTLAAGYAFGPGERLDAPTDLTVLPALTFAPVGLFLVRHRPISATSWLVWGVGVTALLAVTAAAWSGTLPGAWATQWTWWPPFALIPVLLALFPEGDPPSRRRRLMAQALLVSGGLATVPLAVAAALRPRDLLTGVAVKPVEVRLLVAAVATLAVLGAVGTLLTMVSLVRRAVAADGVRRRQFLCLAPAAILFAVGAPADAAGVPHALAPALVALPLGLGIAVLQYGLDDLDLAVHRGVVWAVLTVLVVGTYSVALTVAESLFPARPFWLTVALFAALTLAFDPIRRWVQRQVTRWLWGDRDDAEAVLLRLGRRLGSVGEPLRVLDETVAAVASALRVPLVQVRLADGAVVSRSGREGIPTRSFALDRGGHHLGELDVAPRRLGEEFTDEERILLREVARQTATAVEAHELEKALESARESLAGAREEERLRIRRDLHDGLGPLLTGTRLQLYAARGRLGADDVIDVVLADLAEASMSIKELVEGESATPNVGQAEAVRRMMASLLGGVDHRLRVEGDVEGLPPDVTDAARRIAAEAVTNVAKHARASRCEVVLRADDAGLTVTVTDDGAGATTSAASSASSGGTGRASMRARAAALGGTCTVSGTDTGTTVSARLPLHRGRTSSR